MSAVGKTVESIEESSPDPTTGERRGDRMLIVFTDGTSLEVVSSAHDDSSVDAQLLGRGERAQRYIAAAERESQQEHSRKMREAWLALTCEQREARREPKPPSIMPDFYVDELYEWMMRPSSLFGPREPVTIKERCPKCGERECENAPTKVLA